MDIFIRNIFSQWSLLHVHIVHIFNNSLAHLSTSFWGFFSLASCGPNLQEPCQGHWEEAPAWNMAPITIYYHLFTARINGNITYITYNANSQKSGLSKPLHKRFKMARRFEAPCWHAMKLAVPTSAATGPLQCWHSSWNYRPMGQVKTSQSTLSPVITWVAAGLCSIAGPRSPNSRTGRLVLLGDGTSFAGSGPRVLQTTENVVPFEAPAVFSTSPNLTLFLPPSGLSTHTLKKSPGTSFHPSRPFPMFTVNEATGGWGNIEIL